MTTFARVDPPALADAFGRLHDVGLKRTPQRSAVLRTLAEEGRHLTTQQIFERARVHCPEIGLSTVYRTLTLLGDRGLVAPVAFPDGEASFSLSSAGHHHLLVCSDCARVVELADCDLDGLTGRIGAEQGWAVDDHALVFTGRCSACTAA